jgi:hemoglobin
MSTSRSELFHRLGPDKLRAVITDFYARVFDDVMIGFLFAGKDRQRLIDKEWEFTAHFLGADVAYTGRAMREAHAASPIFGGHFERRLQLLRQALAAHQVDDEVARVWVEHQQALRPLITRDRGSECKDSGVAADSVGALGAVQVGGAVADRAAAAAPSSGLVRLGRRRT